MTRTALSILARAAVTGLVAGLTSVGIAAAHFSTTGTGSASAAAGALTRPAITSAQPGAGTVQLSWSPVTPPAGSGSVTYYVSRDGSPAAGSCPTAASPSAVTSCTDSGLSKGSYSYTVTALWRSWTATSAPASSVTVASGAVSQLAFTTQPDGNPTGGTPFPIQPVVTAEDSGGNTVATYTGTVSLAIKTATGTSGANLTGCSGTPSRGVTTFSGCTIDKAGTGYQLTATDGNLNTTSSTFNIAVGPASRLVFSTQPDGNPTAGAAFPTQPKLTVQDAGGNLVTTDSSTATLSITSGTPAQGGPGSLSGCSQTETGGVISFSGCTIDTAGDGYTLRAVDAGLTGATSAAFNVSTTPPSVAVTYPVNNTTYGSSWTGAITGTASANGGLNLSGTTVAIQDATTGRWWDGSAFNATAASYRAASGTSSWSYGLPASKLTSGHSYAVTAQATDSLGDVGTSSSVGFTYSAVSVSVLTQATASGQTATTGNITTVNGATDLIAVYCYGGSACGSTGGTVSVRTGTGTPFSSAASPTVESIVSSSNPKSCLELIQAVGNGATGPATVSVGSGYTLGWVDVLQLSAGAAVKAVNPNPTTQTSSSTATAVLPAPVANSEIALLGITDGTGGTAITPSTGGGWSQLGSYQQSATVNGGSDLGMYFNPVAQATAPFALSAGKPWGTIAIEVG